MKNSIKSALKRSFNIEVRFVKELIINEAVNLQKKVIFVAIPKTGTTSIRTQLAQPGIPIIENPHLDVSQIKDLIYIYLLKKTLGTNNSFPHKDFVNDAQLRQKAEEIFASFFKFSAVRNPWARAVSLYSRAEGLRLMQKIPFNKFIEDHLYASDTCIHPTLHKNQLDWLISKDGQISMDYIYKVEEYEDAIQKIKEMTNGRLLLDNVKRNVNPESKSSDYRSMYNDNTRRIIAKRFEKDIDYFKYTF